jgi:hypothetical protein
LENELCTSPGASDAPDRIAVGGCGERGLENLSREGRKRHGKGHGDVRYRVHKLVPAGYGIEEQNVRGRYDKSLTAPEERHLKRRTAQRENLLRVIGKVYRGDCVRTCGRGRAAVEMRHQKILGIGGKRHRSRPGQNVYRGMDRVVRRGHNIDNMGSKVGDVQKTARFIQRDVPSRTSDRNHRSENWGGFLGRHTCHGSQGQHENRALKIHMRSDLRRIAVWL